MTLVREDWAANGKDWRHTGTQALVAYRLGCLRNGVRFVILRRTLSFVYRMLRLRASRRGVDLHDTATIGRGVRFPHAGAVVLHKHAVVGDGCWIRQGVTLGGTGRGAWKLDHPTLGQDVRISVGAVLLGPIKIGDGARIGPNCVVTDNVPSGATVMPPQSRVFKL